MNRRQAITATVTAVAASILRPGRLTLEMDESKRGYLHPVPGSEAANIGAGLFIDTLAR